MIFRETHLPGAFVIEPERFDDERGFFARTWCQEEFAAHGLSTRLVQCNISYNKHAGTLRGMHYQIAPHQEVKLVRCTHGAIYDVILDLRPQSPTYLQHVGVTLTADLQNALYVPVDFAHGFITLTDDAEVFYQMSEYYAPQAARGLRWNDPTFAIEWPVAPTTIAERDANYADFVMER